jgi:hypothetical protein
LIAITIQSPSTHLITVEFAAMQETMKGMEIVVSPCSQSTQFRLKLRVRKGPFLG